MDRDGSIAGQRPQAVAPAHHVGGHAIPRPPIALQLETQRQGPAVHAGCGSRNRPLCHFLQVVLGCAVAGGKAQDLPSHDVQRFKIQGYATMIVHLDQIAASWTAFANTTALDVPGKDDPWIACQLSPCVYVSRSEEHT